MTTARDRTLALLWAVDAHARDTAGTCIEEDGELLAIRHLVEALARIVQNHPGVAEFAETHAARAAEALDLIEEED